MQISEAELRQMVRDAIDRYRAQAEAMRAGSTSEASRCHPSHAVLPLVGGDPEGACLIEPAVRCNHCGYCLSLGH
jgi:hypothetical protein